jgi:hypothetical protein
MNSRFKYFTKHARMLSPVLDGDWGGDKGEGE